MRKVSKSFKYTYSPLNETLLFHYNNDANLDKLDGLHLNQLKFQKYLFNIFELSNDIEYKIMHHFEIDNNFYWLISCDITKFDIDEIQYINDDNIFSVDFLSKELIEQHNLPSKLISLI